MTFQTEIDAALAKPVDQDAYKLSGQLCEQFGADAVSYALCLRIRELEAQVEQERWRDAAKEKPQDSKTLVWCYCPYVRGAFPFQGSYSFKNECWFDGETGGEAAVTHWKPINLPSVLTK